MAQFRRVMAVGCSHGEFCHPTIRAQVLEFRRRFHPEVRFDLGDLIDTAAFRSGAAGTKDEAHSTRDDEAAAIRWLQEYEPTHIAWGNHDWRLYELSTHPKAIVRDLASEIWERINCAANGAKTVPYDIKRGWFFDGGCAWGHGFMYNINALRDHAEMLGCSVVMAHKHTPEMCPGRTWRDTPSYCVGALADDEKLTYGRRRRNSLTHSHGFVYGEMSDTEAHLNLVHSANGEPLHLPSWI